MGAELTYLTWTAVLTGVLWLGYIFDRIRLRGVIDAVGYPENPPPPSAWAHRLHKAHLNAVENLVVFASLVLVAVIASKTNDVTATAAMAYFWARVVHVVAYTLALPWVRTLAFFVGFLCQMAIAVQILG